MPKKCHVKPYVLNLCRRSNKKKGRKKPKVLFPPKKIKVLISFGKHHFRICSKTVICAGINQFSHWITKIMPIDMLFNIQMFTWSIALQQTTVSFQFLQ